MAKNSTATSGGIGIAGILFIVFLIMKLASIGAVATWSWWWVTAPLWIPLGVLLLIAILAVIFRR